MTEREAAALPTPEDRAAIQRLLNEYRACPEAVQWAVDKDTFESLWSQCQEPEWMLWALEQLDYRNDATLRLFAAACARRHSPLFSDGRGLHVVEIAEAVANGTAEKGVLATAWNLGRAAVDDLTRSPNWCMARAAATSCACDSVRMDPLEAARNASRNGLRVTAWDVSNPDSAGKEAQSQATLLRKILDQDRGLIFQRARELLAGV